MAIFLIYKNRFNEVKPYEVEILNTNDQTTLVLDIVGDKPKTFKTEHVLSEHSSFEDASVAANKAQGRFTIIPRNKTGRVLANREGKIEVCFTGFKKADKEELIQLAEQSGFFVRTRVAKSLDILVCGGTPGPEKLKKAHKQNVGIVFGKDGFLQFIETGEIAE